MTDSRLFGMIFSMPLVIPLLVYSSTQMWISFRIHLIFALVLTFFAFAIVVVSFIKKTKDLFGAIAFWTPFSFLALIHKSLLIDTEGSLLFFRFSDLILNMLILLPLVFVWSNEKPSIVLRRKFRINCFFQTVGFCIYVLMSFFESILPVHQ